MVPTWRRQDPVGPHVGHVNLAICVVLNPGDDCVHRHQDGKRFDPYIQISQKSYEATDDIVSDTMLFMWFLAATKQLYEWYFLSVCLSVRLSVCPSHLFDYVPIILSSWNFQDLSPRTRVTSMQKVKVRGQRSRSQRSQPN